MELENEIDIKKISLLYINRGKFDMKEEAIKELVDG
jgi:hypothetical protein